MELGILTDEQARQIALPDLLEHLGELQRFRNRLDAYEARVVGIAEDRRAQHVDGERDIADSLAHRQGTSRFEARRKRRIARSVQKSRAAGDAMASGDLNAEQAATLACAKVSDEVRHHLIEKARLQSTDETARAVRVAESEARGETEIERLRRHRSMRSATTFTDRDGMWNLRARLDPESGARIAVVLGRRLKAIHRAQKNDRQVVIERRDQQLADAVAESVLVGAAIPSAPVPQGQGAQQSRSDLAENWTGASPSAADLDRADSETDVPVEPMRIGLNIVIDHDWLIDQCSSAGITEHGHTLSGQALRRLACDADVIPTVLGGAGVVIDHGRTKRTVTAVQRQALIARDRHCVWPDCNAPPIHCDAHHLIHWLNQGPSDFSNLVLLCHRHHIHLHEGGYTLHHVGFRAWEVCDSAGRRRFGADPSRSGASSDPLLAQGSTSARGPEPPDELFPAA